MIWTKRIYILFGVIDKKKKKKKPWAKTKQWNTVLKRNSFFSLKKKVWKRIIPFLHFFYPFSDSLFKGLKDEDEVLLENILQIISLFKNWIAWTRIHLQSFFTHFFQSIINIPEIRKYCIFYIDPLKVHKSI
jgi:hypothetical protein